MRCDRAAHCRTSGARHRNLLRVPVRAAPHPVLNANGARSDDHGHIRTGAMAISSVRRSDDTPGMTRFAPAVPGRPTIMAAMRLACRAPSVHNTQPWPWVFDGTQLQLHTDTDRQLMSIDPHGRQIRDRAKLVVLSTTGESVTQWLHTGEALLAVLLECTAAGLATCALTHITELPAGRSVIAGLLPHARVPQVLVWIGTAPDEQPPPPTPRRPLPDVFTERRG